MIDIFGYEGINKELNIDRHELSTKMTRAIEKGWSISGYHFEEVI